MGAQYMGLRGPKLHTAIAITAGLIFVAFGYGQGDIGGLLTVDTFLTRFPEIDLLAHQHSIHIAVIQGITVATWNLGCFVAAIMAIFLGDTFGRKHTLMMGLVLMCIGKIIQCSSFSFGQYVAGRFIAGMGNGFNASTAPSWQAECTKAHRRGTMLMVSSGTCISAGLAIAYWLDFALAWATPNSVSWRFPVAMQCFWALPALAMLFFLPESPRWLILAGREDEALNVLSALSDAGPEDEDVRAEFLQIKDVLIQMAAATGFKNFFTMGDYRYLHRNILATVLQIFQQFTGINLMTQYLGTMFVTQMRFTPWVGRLLAGCSSTELFLASFVCVVGIDRFWGRRSLTMFGGTGMCLCMIVLAITRYVATNAAHIVQAVAVFAFLAFFAIGWQGMSWLWAVELTPLATRGPANALSTSANWLANFIVVFIGPVAFAHIGYKTYVIFAVFNFLIVPAIYFFYPETGCRSLEEVDVLFYQATQPGPDGRKGNPWLNVVKVANNEPLWYGKDGETPFLYEQSEWHARFARVSDEKDAFSSSGSGTGSGNARGPAGMNAMMGPTAGLFSGTTSEGSENGMGTAYYAPHHGRGTAAATTQNQPRRSGGFTGPGFNERGEYTAHAGGYSDGAVSHDSSSGSGSDAEQLQLGRDRGISMEERV